MAAVTAAVTIGEYSPGAWNGSALCGSTVMLMCRVLFWINGSASAFPATWRGIVSTATSMALNRPPRPQKQGGLFVSLGSDVNGPKAPYLGGVPWGSSVALRGLERPIGGQEIGQG